MDFLVDNRYLLPLPNFQTPSPLAMEFKLVSLFVIYSMCSSLPAFCTYYIIAVFCQRIMWIVICFAYCKLRICSAVIWRKYTDCVSLINYPLLGLSAVFGNALKSSACLFVDYRQVYRQVFASSYIWHSKRCFKYLTVIIDQTATVTFQIYF